MKGHRPLLLLSMVVSSVLGSALGGWLLGIFMGWAWPGDFGLILRAHGQLQVYGFVAMFTMGVAVLMVCSPLRLNARPLWLAYICPLIMLAGSALDLLHSSRPSVLPNWAGPLLQMLSVLAFATVMVLTRRASLAQPRHRESFTGWQLVLLACGTGWLFLSPLFALKDPTKALETTLWGFTGLYIVAIGYRIHPAILGLRSGRASLLPVIAAVWNFALLLRWLRQDGVWSWVMACAVSLFMASLQPFRRSLRPAAGGSWLRPFVRTSYIWLIVATVFTVFAEGSMPGLAGAARHALGSGFVVTMIAGMALRMVAAYEVRRVIWSTGPWVLYFLLLLATLLRVLGQAVSIIPLMAFGGFLQVLAVWLFSALLTATCLWGKDLGYVKK